MALLTYLPICHEPNPHKAVSGSTTIWRSSHCRFCVHACPLVSRDPHLILPYRCKAPLQLCRSLPLACSTAIMVQLGNASDV